MSPNSRVGAQPERELAEAERLWEISPQLAQPRLDRLAGRGVPPVVRAQALAISAIAAAARGSDEGMRAADELLARATRLELGRGRAARVADARLAHARGYLAYKRGERSRVLAELNRAASLYPEADPRRAQVFDTLGMFFQHTIGDVERAREYFVLSVELKEAAQARGVDQRYGLALTYGNLGRLELSRERFDEAARWFQKDLEVVLSIEPRPPVEAGIRNHLALAYLGAGPHRFADARAELERALELVAKGGAAHAYLLKDLARVALAEGRLDEAAEHLHAARGIAQEKGMPEVLLFVRFVEAQVAGARAQRPDDDASTSALAALNEVRAGFDRLHMPRETCEADLAIADLYLRIGRKEEALRVLVDGALPIAERSLFGQLQPLQRIEARIGELDPLQLARQRTRRMLGGIPPDQFSGRLRGDRSRLTVWTCDIRGFTNFCDETKDPLLVVDMLNRLFAAIGRLILDNGGYIDKYVGDNILAYFREPMPAAGVSLAALEAVRQLNTERTHLRARALDIGIGVATGEVVEGNVGFSGKLEHTIIGTPVNAACRLVGEARPGEILVDGATREALGRAFKCARPGRAIKLKGLPNVSAFTLRGRNAPER